MTRWPVDTETGQVNCQLSILKSALLGPYLREEWAKPLSPSLFGSQIEALCLPIREALCSGGPDSIREQPKRAARI